MTCIVAVKDGGRVVLAADSEMTAGYVKVPLASTKVVRAGAWAFGVVGGPAVAAALASWPDPPEPPAGGPDDAYMAGPFLDALHGRLSERRLVRDDCGVPSIGPDEDGSRLIVARGGALWLVQRTFEPVTVADSWLCIGSGAEVAYGVLWATRCTRMTAEARARVAIEAAIRYSSGCGGEPVIIWTDAEGGDDAEHAHEFNQAARRLREAAGEGHEQVDGGSDRKRGPDQGRKKPYVQESCADAEAAVTR